MNITDAYLETVVCTALEFVLLKSIVLEILKINETLIHRHLVLVVKKTSFYTTHVILNDVNMTTMLLSNICHLYGKLKEAYVSIPNYR